MGAHFEALTEGVLMAPLDPRYTQVGFNLISVQVCLAWGPMLLFPRPDRFVAAGERFIWSILGASFRGIANSELDLAKIVTDQVMNLKDSECSPR